MRNLIASGLGRLWPALLLVPVLATTAFAQQRTMGLLLLDSAACSGYTLFAPMPYNRTYLIDNEGREVHSWPSSYYPGQSAYLREDGLLLYTCRMGNTRFPGGGRGGRVELIDWDGNLTWSFNYTSEAYCQHHDVEPLPNGNILMIAWEYKTRVQALGAGRNPNLLSGNALWPDHVIEIDPTTDSIVWEWHVWDHLVQNYSDTLPNYGLVRNHPELVNLNYIGVNTSADWCHSNSVKYNPVLDQIALTVRHFSEIWVIDHSTTTEQARGHTGGRYGRGGDLLFRWGNPAAYNRGNVSPRRLYLGHDGNWVAAGRPGAGNLMVFNNGDAPGRAWSEVAEFTPPVDSLGNYYLEPDSGFGPDSLSWSFRDSTWFYSDIISGCERMPNGNTLVCEGTSGTIFEVTPDRRLVWLYRNPVCDSGPMFQYEPIPAGSNQVFKTRRYAADFPGFRGRNLEPGGPIERYPAGVGGSPPAARGPASRLTVQPSPFREQAEFGFTLDAPGSVELDVYDSRGFRVAEPVRGRLPAGAHSRYWQPGPLPSGTYFVRLRTATGTATARLVVMP